MAFFYLSRYFHVKKADYTFYGQEQGGGAAGGGGGVTIPNEDHEMTYVAGMFLYASLKAQDTHLSCKL